jgi:hypothetical protein
MKLNRLARDVADGTHYDGLILRGSVVVAVVLGSVAASLSYWTYRHFGGPGFFLPMTGFIAVWTAVFGLLNRRLVIEPKRRSMSSREREDSTDSRLSPGPQDQ